MKIRYNLGGGRYVEAENLLSPKEIATVYGAVDMDKMLILTDEKGGFKCALNPKMIVSIEAV